MKLVLTISHNLFLTHEQRYDLARGRDLTDIIGISTPVWVDQVSGRTSEPAIETFARYKLTNKKGDHPIKAENNMYEINIPQIPDDYTSPTPVSLKTWRKMSNEAQLNWYRKNMPPPSGENLLDLKDGGSEYLKFEEHNFRKKDEKTGIVGLVHFVEIKPLETLEESLV